MLQIRVRWNPSSLVFTEIESDGFDDFEPPPPVNIIHPKPAINFAPRNFKVLSPIIMIVQNPVQLMTDLMIGLKIQRGIYKLLLNIVLVNLLKCCLY